MVLTVNVPPTGEVTSSRHKHTQSLFMKVVHDSLQLSSNNPEGWKVNSTGHEL